MGCCCVRKGLRVLSSFSHSRKLFRSTTGDLPAINSKDLTLDLFSAVWTGFTPPCKRKPLEKLWGLNDYSMVREEGIHITNKSKVFNIGS